MYFGESNVIKHFMHKWVVFFTWLAFRSSVSWKPHSVTYSDHGKQDRDRLGIGQVLPSVGKCIHSAILLSNRGSVYYLSLLALCRKWQQQPGQHQANSGVFGCSSNMKLAQTKEFFSPISPQKISFCLCCQAAHVHMPKGLGSPVAVAPRRPLISRPGLLPRSPSRPLIKQRFCLTS